MSDVAEAVLRTYPWLAAPTDGSRLVAEGDILRATGDGTRYAVEDGIPRLLIPTDRRAAAIADAAFAPSPGAQAPDPPEPTLLKMLPYAARPEEGPGLWLRKRVAWEWLERTLDDAEMPEELRAVDAGAGIGWLARRLALRGAYVVALDRSTDDRFGLGGALRLAGDAQAPFLPVQADFARPPILAASADLVVFCESLPPAPRIAETLARYAALLRPGGLFAVIDSPISPEPVQDDPTIPSHAQMDAALTAAGLTAHDWYEPEQTVPRLIERFTRRDRDRAPALPRPCIAAVRA